MPTFLDDYTTTEMLWQGQVEDVILACKTLESQHPNVQPTSMYFANNAERMRYGLLMVLFKPPKLARLGSVAMGLPL